MKTRQRTMLSEMELTIPVALNDTAYDEGDVEMVVVRKDNALQFEDMNWCTVDELQDAIEIAKAFILWKTSKLKRL